MIPFRYILFFLILNITSLKANEVEIIELHQNKSLDQLVLDSGNLDQEKQKNNLDNISSKNTQNNNEDLNEEIIGEEIILITDDYNNNNEVINISKSKTVFDLDENIISNHIESISDIKSNTLHKEFIKILSNPDLGVQKDISNKIYFVIKKLYEIGEIGKAYNLIKSIDIKNISNQENLNYFYFIELNYLFSTFNLSEACELKTFLLNASVNLSKFLLEKTDIFCLTLENKLSEAKLLNSLLLDSEKEVDKNFQNLFNYMNLIKNDDQSFQPLTEIKSEELIFLYSAMLRINELALDEEFIKIDPLNLSIPVILSSSTEMDIRIKAANKAFYDGVLSIDSLAALYQSVDFNSNEFNQPKKTILSLNNNEMIMAFYLQLSNIQIFPDQRLNVILDYWQFAKKSGLEKIAYSITKNIIETFNPTSENVEFGMEIAFAHISNKNYNEAIKWIDLYENSNNNIDTSEYAKFLIALNETNQLDTIISYLSDNYVNLRNSKDQETLEIIEVLIDFLKLEKISQSNILYNKIQDDRLMPSYFLLKDIEKNIQDENDLSFFMLTLISINNKSWSQLHPEHLSIILNAYNMYDQGSLIKPIIMEILDEIEIF